MIIELQLIPAVHCFLSTRNSALCIIVPNNAAENCVIPCDGNVLKTVPGHVLCNIFDLFFNSESHYTELMCDVCSNGRDYNANLGSRLAVLWQSIP
jgi:hypothetical protein